MSVELRKDQEDRKAAREEQKKKKGPSEFFGSNIGNLLNLCGVDDAADLPPVWKDLCAAPKHQQLHVLQQSVVKACEVLKIRVPIVLTPAILKLALGLGFCLDSRDDLTTGLHHFMLGQHTPAERKRLKEVAARYDMVMGG